VIVEAHMLKKLDILDNPLIKNIKNAIINLFYFILSKKGEFTDDTLVDLMTNQS
jgi:hypothetical protein